MRRIASIIQLLRHRQIAVGFVTAVLLVGFGFAMSFYSYSHSQADNGRIAHSLQSINRLEDLLSSTKDIEAGARGYLASEDPVFLEVYYTAIPKLSRQLSDLRRLYRGEPANIKAVDTLERLVAAKLDIARKQIRLSDKSNRVIRREYMLIGKLRMDRMRSYIDKLLAAERQRMAARNVIARESFRNSLGIIFALSMLTFIALVTLYRLLDGELRQRAENEAQLRAYEQDLQEKIRQLEVSNHELERMAFVASHDMQEPLRKIRAFGDLLTEQCSPSLQGDGRMFLSKIITSADRMSLLIRDLLNYSRIKSQREPFVGLPLNDLVDRVLGDLELSIQESEAIVRRGDLPVIDAAALQLEQLFTNLLSNALKYIRPGVQPQIAIEARQLIGGVHPGLSPLEKYVQLTISDNGIGFNEKYLDRIFDLFQRLHPKSHYKGTGIGLAICKRVVDYHGGYITASSREGIGTTFIVVLPEKQIVVEATTPPTRQVTAQSVR